MRLETAYSACLRSWVTTVVRRRFPISGVILPTPGGRGAVDNDTSRPGAGSDARSLSFTAPSVRMLLSVKPYLILFLNNFSFMGSLDSVGDGWSSFAIFWYLCYWLYQRRIFFKL
jgi:hypothetical protein